MGVLMIPLYYTVGRRLFGWRTAGLLAAALVTMDQSAIMWGARARMYTQAHLFVLLSLALLLESTLHHPGERKRYLFLLVLAAALFSHTVTFLILAPLAATLLWFSLTYVGIGCVSRVCGCKPFCRNGAGRGTGVVSMGQTGSTVSWQDPNTPAPHRWGWIFYADFLLPASTRWVS
jgi:dolichyl-phosphate-mannose--protein O-mannosyl transferase